MRVQGIDARKGPDGRIAVVLTDIQGRLVSHLIRPEEAEHLAENLMSLARGRGTIAEPAP